MLPCFLIYTLLNIPRTVKKAGTMFILMVVGFVGDSKLRNYTFIILLVIGFTVNKQLIQTLSNDRNM